MIVPMIAVKDVDASVAFYTEKLGFKHDFSMPGADGKNNFGWVSLGKASFGFTQDPDAHGGDIGVVFIVYVADEVDLDQYYAEVQSRGTIIATPIKDQYWGDRTFDVHDPDGYILAFTKTTQPMSPNEIEAAHQNQSHG